MGDSCLPSPADLYHKFNFAHSQQQVEPKTKITLTSYDKQLLGVTAAKIRSFRPPEPYRGKGVKYAEEVIKRKEGKSAGK